MSETAWFDSIANKEQVKKKLSELKERQKKAEEGSPKDRDRFVSEIRGHAGELFKVLSDGEAALRKNVPGLLAALDDEETLLKLYRAYESEETLYVRGAILKAISSMDHESIDESLGDVLEKLEKTELTDDNRKHLIKERELLTAMLSKGREKHRFTGYSLKSGMALITNKNFKELVLKELKGIEGSEFAAGVILETDKVKEVLSCRLYESFFFLMPGLKVLPSDPAEAAEILKSADILGFADARHDGGAPYRFRVTLKRAENNDRGRFLKRICAAVEEGSGFGLVNDQNDYDFEIRLVERTNGDFSVLFKFAALGDPRFFYRRESVAASIRPYNAALTAALASDFLKPGSVVLDPFCGVGTMMAERMARCPVKAFYGIDVFGEAVEKAKRNIDRFLKLKKSAGKAPAVYFINKDFFKTELDHVIDEVFTDMPFAMGKTTKRDIEGIYERFFEATDRILSREGHMILYTHDMPLVQRYSKAVGFVTVKSFKISAREDTYVCVLRRRNEG